MTEKEIQTIMYNYFSGFYDFNFKPVIMITNFSPFEGYADLLRITDSGYTHEYEIKRTAADYKADFKKKKHNFINIGLNTWIEKYMPNYFWYITDGFDIDPPEYAGLINITDNRPIFIKEAPCLHKNKLNEKSRRKIERAIFYRYWNLHKELYKI